MTYLYLVQRNINEFNAATHDSRKPSVLDDLDRLAKQTEKAVQQQRQQPKTVRYEKK